MQSVNTLSVLSSVAMIALMFVTVVFIVPTFYRIWRNYSLGINRHQEAAWDEMRQKLHGKAGDNKVSLEKQDEKEGEAAFNAYLKSLIADHIQTTQRAKQVGQLLIIFLVIMIAQAAYAVSHMLNIYYGIPTIGNVRGTNFVNTTAFIIMAISAGVAYFYKRRDIKERCVLLDGVADEYGVTGEFTLERLEAIDMSQCKAKP